MKLFNFISTAVLATALGAIVVSCSKKETEPKPASSNHIPDRATVIKALKNMKFSFTESGSGNYNYNSSNNSFTYVNPNTGATYTEPGTGFSYNGVETRVFGNISKGGGSFEVDGKSIQLDYVLCLSADNGDEEGLFGAELVDGVSMLVGISGKFDPNDEEGSKIDYLVIAFVSEEKANGTYKVLFEGDADETDLEKFAFFYVADLTKVDSMENFEESEDAKLYFSTGGSLSFSNGNVTLNDIKMAEIINEDLGKETSASGELTCE